MKHFKTASKYLSVPVAMFMATSAHAAGTIQVPASLDTLLAELQAAALAMADKMWPYMLAILGAFILLRLGKKFVNKIG
ncbi:major coat protein [Aeromonas sp. SCS5]|uniref:major coat protein n=1 Tax=Aeromonas sp. SCS5 TaxID=1519205 RepID=UPI0009039C0C|nr:major coat protein [Aeromonas sp. SCS5]